MGGKSGGTTVIQPTPAPQPSTADAIKEYVNSLPQLFAAQLQYAPQEAAQQVQLAQQYAGPLAQAYRDAQMTLYPETASLTENLSRQATDGMNGQVPEWMKNQYLDSTRAQLGDNAFSGAGADYLSRGLLDQNFQYQNYWRNLGLSLSDKAPLAQPQSPGFTNQLGNYTPGQGLSYTASTYGNYLGASRPLLGQSGTPNWAIGANAAGNVLGGIGGKGKGFMGLF